MPIDTFKHKGLRKRLCAELREKGINDEAVLAAIEKIPRHFFLESTFDAIAYEDRTLYKFPVAYVNLSHQHLIK